jgi:hypothetical protein
MTAKEISAILSAGLCIVVALIVGLLGTGVAEQVTIIFTLVTHPKLHRNVKNCLKQSCFRWDEQQNYAYPVDPYSTSEPMH